MEPMNVNDYDDYVNDFINNVSINTKTKITSWIVNNNMTSYMVCDDNNDVCALKNNIHINTVKSQDEDDVDDYDDMR